MAGQARASATSVSPAERSSGARPRQTRPPAGRRGTHSVSAEAPRRQARGTFEPSPVTNLALEGAQLGARLRNPGNHVSLNKKRRRRAGDVKNLDLNFFQPPQRL